MSGQAMEIIAHVSDKRTGPVGFSRAWLVIKKMRRAWPV